MKPFKFIHAADLHLDSPFKGLTDIPHFVKEELIQSSFTAFSRLIDMAIDEQVSFIVISGDLFDAEQRSLQAQLFLYRQFERLKEHRISVYIIHGNHDPLSKKQQLFEFGDHVHIFSAEEVTALPAYKDNEVIAYIYGISYGEKAVYENLAKRYFKNSAQAYHIAMYHGTVGATADHEPYAPCSLQDLVSLQYDYVALGHIHKTSILNVDPPIVYAGNIQGRHRKEDGERGCYLVHVNANKQAQLQYIPLAPITWLTVEIDCAAIEIEQQLIQAIQQEVNTGCNNINQSYIVTVQLYGVTELHQHLSLPSFQLDLLEAVRSLFPQTKYWIYINRLDVHTSMLYDQQKLIEEEPFLQKLNENMEQLQHMTTEQLIKLGSLSELWSHHELARLLPEWQNVLLDGSLDEALTTILDFVAQEKGRE